MELSYIREFQSWVSDTPLSSFKNTCYEYVRWQNTATQFYISTRILYYEKLIGPAAFCSFQALENLMKATLIFYTDVKFAESFGHSLKKLERTINNK